MIAPLGDHNVRVVMLGAAALGVACGVIGTFLTLRRRALVGDAISHAALPGIGAAFLVAVGLGWNAKSLPLLLAGGALGGAAGAGAMLLLRRFSPLREDAIVASVLSVFFGAGIVLLSAIQGLTAGHAAGLETFVYGRAASMVESDAALLAAVAAVVVGAVAILWKELRLLCFDEPFARSLGLRAAALDAALMALVTLVTVAGMQAVGLILVVALQVIPAAAARCWSHRLGVCTLAAALVGAASGTAGALLSAMAPSWPSGALMVLVAAAILAFSLLAGAERGALRRWLAHWRAARRVALEHLLRALFEEEESRTDHDAGGSALRGAASGGGTDRAALRARRRFQPGALRGAIRRARRAGLVLRTADGSIRLTADGRVEAERLTARHRLWEHFLIERAGVRPSHVDRDADLVEHVLSPELLARVARAVGAAGAAISAAPASPHPLVPGGARAESRDGAEGAP